MLDFRNRYAESKYFKNAIGGRVAVLQCAERSGKGGIRHRADGAGDEGSARSADGEEHRAEPLRDPREGRSPMRRRMYMEGK